MSVNERRSTARLADLTRSSAFTRLREVIPAGRARETIATEVLAGLSASLLAVAYCLSFSALLFQGELRGGLAMGLWALLAGSALSGLYVAFTSTLSPVAAGPNNPAVAVLSVLATAVSGLVLAGGGSPKLAVSHVLLSFALATLATGLALYVIGRLRLGQYVRFVPYPVIGGFLAASGWLLAAGGLKVVTGQSFDVWNLSSSFPEAARSQVLVAAGFAAAVYGLRAATGQMNALPIAFIVLTLLLDLALWGAGLRTPDSGWYLSGSTEPQPWFPVVTVREPAIDWGVLAAVTPEIASAAGVTVLALLLDVSGLEVKRTHSADLDWEFRTNGAANLISVPLGGVMGKLSVNGTRLLDETGGRYRLSGLVAALVIASVALFGIDLARLVPAPILGGLLLYIGITVLADVLLRSPAQRAWSDYALALIIMFAIVRQGYLAGVILGFVGACLMFALSYSRIAVIRRHLTRSVFASNVDRSTRAARFLAENGERIHIFWLSGYIFFGSSHRMFEAIRASMMAAPGGRRSFAVLDFSDVAGLDTSALLSLVKLKNHAGEQNVTLAIAGPSERMRSAFEHVGLIGYGLPHRTFATRNGALEWCEEELLAETTSQRAAAQTSELADWLEQALGRKDMAGKLVPYFERRVLAPGTVLYLQNEPADTLDLVLEGSVAVTIAGEPGLAQVVRRMAKRTVVGEMGFFRSSRRTATVVAEPDTIVYTLTRQSYLKLLSDDPAAGAALLEFIVRTLSDRLEFANSGIAALS